MSRRGGRAAAVVATLAIGAAMLGTDAGATPRRSGVHSYGAAPAALQRSAAPGPQLPLGGRRIFPDHILVAYYGTAHTPALGVLGEGTIPRMTQRLRSAARPYSQSGKKVQIVYELIASVADRSPGADRNYSHFIPRAYVEEFIRAAHRNRALLVLDLQPGRQHFLPQAKHFAWALRKPWVGLALDPEWRMGPHQVPGQSIGSVAAAEVNRVSQFLARVTRVNNLPQKVFMVHQFRREMVRNIGNVVVRPPLATVQHIDGFGSRTTKRATFQHVQRADKFQMGFKLFYDEDVNMFAPRDVLGIRPRVDYVSYQ